MRTGVRDDPPGSPEVAGICRRTEPATGAESDQSLRRYYRYFSNQQEPVECNAEDL